MTAPSQPRAAGPNLILCLLLPFAAGYFLSYLYRTVNAILGPVIAQELSLPDNALGFLTSAYFLAFGAAQIPLGLLLDRFGPRRVEAILLVIAALGAAVFSQAESLFGLSVGRALIGLGVSACLMASMKAFTQWFAAERLAGMTGWIMASGGLGALVAAKPLEMALEITHWRGIVLALALLTLAVAAILWWVVPDKENHAASVPLRQQLSEVRAIFADPHFQRYAPMGFAFIGGFMAVQGLWASRWMNVLEHLDGAAVAIRLTWMGIAMLSGFICVGFFATKLVHHGVSLAKLYLGAMIVAAFALTMICLWPQFGGALFWPLLGACFSLANMAYSLVAQAFPAHWSGRASTAFNLLVFAGAFGLQWGIGALVDALHSMGLSSAEAYRSAFFLLLACQLLALAWFVFPRHIAAREG
ncbi:MFS transporter [Azonexus sp.]|uniref:MFS transporter n=1 Tax=Azonexus sp. TaxID=1872668 RepID=UPI0039E35CB7